MYFYSLSYLFVYVHHPLSQVWAWRFFLNKTSHLIPHVAVPNFFDLTTFAYLPILLLFFPPVHSCLLGNNPNGFFAFNVSCERAIVNLRRRHPLNWEDTSVFDGLGLGLWGLYSYVKKDSTFVHSTVSLQCEIMRDIRSIRTSSIRYDLWFRLVGLSYLSEGVALVLCPM